MTVYALAQITITDRDAYQRYLSRFMEVFQQFRGRLLAADEAPEQVEGEWGYQKAILMSFPDAQAFREWSQSEQYITIARDRKAGSHGVVLLLQGLQ
ncbi:MULTISPECIES: DUF1330 domain-containing protein [Alcanivoracaceae]|jgi:uncharacterized protein (DUF1330 family)|uniref:DUF1330 domain-containing protein n=3 Tax=Alcanivoracaceae TaxID=224372 RepID=K0CCG9_ALCDB|nr:MULTISPECIES: DUF1330 domain-containing protein [Alcanivoracaceae]ERS14972.1 hypothetical protein Q668_08345 [Alcanivorax sp. PN-3]MBA4722536.1 DUF1330 domain-containing protein [Alcanivorax sp.]AFT69231.1 hypothetical protein B5T_00947 [Alloalcanivorax dieselolei B5]ARB44771.1 hypothetical protein P40_04480 [Alloalcanivorax xenomutans]KAF0807289.1 hypothetical protein A6D6_00841 [Alcanivorax xiamenensis]|tara:strand:- start:726 stop:1016 length:291 start_codon:yes stop_codon:yes gene_type:complete